MAILKVSEGSELKLREYVTVAKRDYRDVLFWAEYPQESRIDTPEKRQEVRVLHSLPPVALRRHAELGAHSTDVEEVNGMSEETRKVIEGYARSHDATLFAKDAVFTQRAPV